MDELNNWILATGGALLVGWVGFIVKLGVTQVVKKLDAILTELKELNKMTVAHEEQIKGLHERVSDHESRIRDLEA